MSQTITTGRDPVPGSKRISGSDASEARALAHDLSSVVAGEVRFDAGSRALYSRDGSNYRQIPIGVVVPRDADDVAATVEKCRIHGAPILARGGGTSLAGQCCNVAVVLDFSKYMNDIVEFVPEEGWARVQPGVVLDRLNQVAKPYDLAYGPDPSTHDHCTFGGMIGNNSCGVHSVIAGRTVDNVHELDVLTYRGQRLTLGAVPDDDELNRIIAEGGFRGEAFRSLCELRDRYAHEIRERFPDIPRRVSGYCLDELLPENGFHVARSLVGTECTCVLLLEAKVRLVHAPPKRTLAVACYADAYEAGDHIPLVMEQNPIGLEGIDDRLIEDMRKKRLHPEDLALFPTGYGGWLLIEFGGDTQAEANDHAERAARVLRGAGVEHVEIYEDAASQATIWEIRESGLGATAFVPGQHDSWPGWEDSAVHPERLGDYLRDLRSLLRKHDYEGSLYGHFGQGLVHTRIDFDLKSRNGLDNYRAFVEEAADLCSAYDGSYSGEHGDGQARGELLSKMYGDDLVDAFRQFKRIWDPDGMMNPGKVIDADPMDTNLVLGPDYAPLPVHTYFHYPEDDGDFAHAALRCVGVGECRRDEGGTMCPSYMVTHEERHTTRGRARTLYEMLQGDVITDGWRSEEVKEALDLCLACKGCKSDCPADVDMATYKAEFLAHYYEHNFRPRSAWAMGHIDQWARLASKMPRLLNTLVSLPVVSGIAKWMGGIAPQRELPAFAAEPFTTWFRRRESRNIGGPQVLLWPDTFNNFLHPETAQAAVEVLEAAGCEVVVPEVHLCCGRPLYDYGLLERAKSYLHKILTELEPQIQAGTPLVALEPSCLAVFRDEMLNLLPHDQNARRLAKQSFTLSEFLNREMPEFHLPKLSRSAILHGHCHHKAVLGFNDELKILDRLELDYRLLDSGCCGMAGSFGFEAQHYDISIACGERVLLPEVRHAPTDQLIIADGFSCQEQIEQQTGRGALHIAQIIRLALEDQQTQGDVPQRIPERAFRVDHHAERLSRGELAGIAAGVGVGLFLGLVVHRSWRDR